MSNQLDIREHQNWLGYLQPDGLVVSPAALVDSGIYYDRNVRPVQQDFLKHLLEFQDWQESTDATLTNLPAFFSEFLQWREDDFVSGEAVPDKLRIFLKSYGETLFPHHAVKSPDQPGTFQMLVLETSAEDLDKPAAENERGWHVSPTKRFERLLRETDVPIGLLSNGTHLRLLYAPAGENPGSITFPVAAMAEIAGRPILGGFRMLLDDYRLFQAVEKETLPAILQKSRDFQANVSTDLASQVLDGLYELLRGLQSANFKTEGELLAETIARRPDAIYEAQLNVLMRLVFLLFAEDRGLMPNSSIYQQHYSVHALYDQLRQDHERYPDTMDQRFGAWARLLSVFRLVFDGSYHKQMSLPARLGYLFDPTRFPFLEGRDEQGELTEHGLPRIPDSTVHIVLSKLLYLKGDKLSYRTLDVEQIGSVYETMMGFRLQIADGPTIAIKPKKKSGAPTNINLAELLATEAKDRKKWFKEQTDRDLPTKTAAALKDATNEDEALASLEKLIALTATPRKVQAGALLLQPSEERRKSGSHYTPRKLTEPIVRKALEPILANLTGRDGSPSHPPTEETSPLPSEILDLKVCDPAVGSGAFLVEACRQLGSALVAAWAEHGGKPVIPTDEDELLHARRLVAQRCLYGVDRNPMAADLCKLSLWLATLAKDHPFTFLDHSIRFGDSLVGLSKKQILHFHWDLTHKSAEQLTFGQDKIEKQLKRALKCRLEILQSGDNMLPFDKIDQLRRADEALALIRKVGDLCLTAFFDADKKNARQDLRDQRLDLLTTAETESNVKQMLNSGQKIKSVISHLKSGEHTFAPFHWNIEFPEVFEKGNPGFDCILGNPPYAGKNTIVEANHTCYPDWLKILHTNSHGNSDLVAHFFRSALELLRNFGTFGLIATKTIRQGDTRHTGLRWVCVEGGATIYAAQRRYKWTGTAAVTVSVIWVSKSKMSGPFQLDRLSVPFISAYLFHQGGNENPATLSSNQGLSFQGSILLGMGFTFDDTDKKGIANSLTNRHELLKSNSRNLERIRPLIGWSEVANNPEHEHHRFTIDFFDLPLTRQKLSLSWTDADGHFIKHCRKTGIVPIDYPEEVASDWPDLLEIVKLRVKPDRDKQSRDALRERWWQFAEKRPGLYSRAVHCERVLVAGSQATAHFAFAFLPADIVYSSNLSVITADSFSSFSCVQSFVHEEWSRFFMSTLEDRLAYTTSTCFETYPFPENWVENESLESVGQTYYDYRADLMVSNEEGLTKTYNRFHNPEESSPEIHKLRELHAEMDRAVLDAYGWNDIPTDCEFIPDYFEEDKDGNEVPKSIRYRWPDEVRDEVLARLLALNAERYQQEVLAGLHANKAAKKGAKKKSTNKRAAKKSAKKKTAPTLIEVSEDSDTLPGMAPWEQVIDDIQPTLPADIRFPMGGAARYYQFLLRALIQEAGGSLSYSLLSTAISQLNTRDDLQSYWQNENSEFYQSWQNNFKEDTGLTGFHMAEEQLFTTSGEARLTGTAPDFEARLTGACPTVSDPWFLLDAHLLLKSALATHRAGKAGTVAESDLSRIVQFVA